MIDTLYKINSLENLSKLKGTYNSKNNKFKAIIFTMSNMVFIHIYSHENSMSKLEADEIDLKRILNKNLETSYSAITGNFGTVGTINIYNNTLSVMATSENGLKNSFYGSIFAMTKWLENLIKVDTGITGDYTKVGTYNFTFPKIYKQVLGVAINVYKTRTATTLENVYVTSFNNTGFSFVKDCVDSSRANTVKVAYTVFYI